MQLITDEIRTALIANGQRFKPIRTLIRIRSSSCSRPTRPLPGSSPPPNPKISICSSGFATWE